MSDSQSKFCQGKPNEQDKTHGKTKDQIDGISEGRLLQLATSNKGKKSFYQR